MNSVKSHLLLLTFTLALLSSACGSSGGSSSDGDSSSSFNVFVATSDSTTGSFSTVNQSTRAVNESIGSIHADAMVREYGGLVYVVNRLNADNVQVLDPNNGYATTLQFSVGAGSNPQDIAFVSSTKAYVSRLGSADLLIVNPTTGEHLGTIDLTAYADSDGIPEAAKLHVTGGKLYVAVQALDRNSFFSPTGQSAVVVIDTITDTITVGIMLPFQNPFGGFSELSGGRLAISCVGSFMVADGGIVIIDTVSNTAVTSLVTESVLGGDVGDVVFVSDTEGFAIVSDSSFNTILVRFNTAGSAGDIYQTAGFKLLCVATDGDEVLVCDASDTGSGIQVFDADSGLQLTDSPITTGLPPRQILFL